MDKSSGVGVVDKVVAVLRALEAGPAPLAVLVTRTGLPRATVHRLASALAVHGLVRVDAGVFALGPRLAEMGGGDPLPARAQPVLERLRDATGCSAQLWQRAGSRRLCVAAADLASGLRDTIPVGSRLPMTAGSAAQALLADAHQPPAGAAFGMQALAAVRRRGIASSVAERAPGVASVSSPVRNADGNVVAAVSVSGPVTLLGRSPGRTFGDAVLAAAADLEAGFARG